jgi:hypothetical protein
MYFGPYVVLCAECGWLHPAWRGGTRTTTKDDDFGHITTYQGPNVEPGGQKHIEKLQKKRGSTMMHFSHNAQYENGEKS